jgi:hypothetical protein
MGDWESRTMLLLQLDDSRYDSYCYLTWPIDTYGPIDDQGYGSLSGHHTDYDNWVEDSGSYEAQVEYDATADNYYSYKRKDWHITHSYRNDGSTFGLSFSHYANYYGTYESNSIYGDYNEGWYGFNFLYPQYYFSNTYDREYTDLFEISDGPHSIYNSSADYDTKRSTPTNIIRASLQRPCGLFPDSKMRIDLAYIHSKYEINVVDKLHYYTWLDPNYYTSIYQTLVGDGMETYRLDSSVTGGMFMPGIQLTKDWNEDVYSWFRLDVGFGSYDIDYLSVNRYTYSGEYRNEFSEIEINNNTYNWKSEMSGDMKQTYFGFFHKTVAKFGEKITCAAGLKFEYTKEDANDLDAVDSRDDTLWFDDGDSAPNDYDDYVRYINFTKPGTVSYESKRSIITLPLALEYKIKKWTLRMGAVHRIYNSEYITGYDYDVFSRYHDSASYGDGSAYVADSMANYDDAESLEETNKYYSQSTDFIYGLEYAATKNLNVELIYFLQNSDDYYEADIFDLDFYQGLRFSFTLKF